MPNHAAGRHVYEQHAMSLLRVGSTVKMEVAYASETVLSTFNTTTWPNPQLHKMHHLHWGNPMTYSIQINYIRAAISEWNSDTKHMYASVTIQRRLRTDCSRYKQ